MAGSTHWFRDQKLLSATHDAVQALTLRAGQRERSVSSILTLEQQSKLLLWSNRNRARMAQSTACVSPSLASPLQTQREPSPHFHVAANLYIAADRLAKVLETAPPAAPLVSGRRLKKLSRRPCLESIKSCDEKPMQRESSCGSLKRNASEMSLETDGDEAGKHHAPAPICPVDAEARAAPTLHQALGFVQDLLPPVPALDVPMNDGGIPQAAQAMPIELPVPTAVLSYQASLHQSAPVLGSLSSQQQVQQNLLHNGGHRRRSSFLPAHLNVVPEEMWPGEEAEEFLLDMIDGDDWAIGEGIDMDNL